MATNAMKIARLSRGWPPVYHGKGRRG